MNTYNVIYEIRNNIKKKVKVKAINEESAIDLSKQILKMVGHKQYEFKELVKVK